MTETTIELLPLTDKDIAQVAQWNVQLHEDEGSVPMAVDAAQQRIVRWLQESRFQALLFCIDAIPFGYLLYEQKPLDPDQRGKPSVYIRQFFIEREKRKLKLGSQAFHCFLDTYVAAGANITLDVKISNPTAQRFWESFGFEADCIEYELKR